jgi:hypothetical protein
MRPNYYTPQMQQGMYIQPGMLGAGGGNPMQGGGMGAQGGQMPQGGYGGGMPQGASGNPMGGFMGNNTQGGMGSLLAQLFGGGHNPADAANQYLNKIPGTLKPYYNPYINAGHEALGNLQGQYGQLLNDPGKRLNEIGGSFQQSPGFQFQRDQALNAANHAASAGGIQGSPQAQQNASTVANGVANQDYYNYLNHAMGLYGMGLQGEQGINQMGYNASDQLAQSLGANLQSQGLLAYQGQDWQNQQKSGLWNSIGNMFGNLDFSKLPFMGG